MSTEAALPASVCSVRTTVPGCATAVSRRSRIPKRTSLTWSDYSAIDHTWDRGRRCSSSEVKPETVSVHRVGRPPIAVIVLRRSDPPHRSRAHHSVPQSQGRLCPLAAANVYVSMAPQFIPPRGELRTETRSNSPRGGRNQAGGDLRRSDDDIDKPGRSRDHPPGCGTSQILDHPG